MEQGPSERTGALLSLLGGLASWAAVSQVGEHYADFSFDLGSIVHITPRYAAFLLYETVLGGLGVLLVALGLAGLLRDPSAWQRVSALAHSSERRFVIAASLLAFALPLLIQLFVLDSVAITDDESAYLFMAQVLSGGSVTAPSPEPKLYFDRLFMINDGRLFSQYFLGWPALMAPAVPLGLTNYVNPALCAATVPAVFYVGRRLTGPRGARLCVVLFVVSPMLMIGAATGLSHTSCLCLLVWSHACLEFGRERRGGGIYDAGFGLFLAGAFFVRPLTTVGLGIPLLWSFVRSAQGRARGGAAVGAFGLPTVVLAAAFLAVNAAQTGSAFRPAYQYLYEYAAQNDFRFSAWWVGHGGVVRNMAFADPGESISVMASGLVRLNAALFGWPVSLLFLPLALGLRRARPVWAMMAVFLLAHLPLTDVGVDSFGPVHYTELAWPVILLSVLGLRRASVVLRRSGGTLGERYARLPGLLMCSSVLAAAALYVPTRLDNLRLIVEDAGLPLQTVARAKLGPAVVFSPRPFTPRCHPRHPVPAHFVFWRPNNDPDLQNETLWVNHLSVRADRELMRHFPERTGWLLRYQDCLPRLERIDDLDPASVEPGWIRNRMTPRGIVREFYEDPPSARGDVR